MYNNWPAVQGVVNERQWTTTSNKKVYSEWQWLTASAKMDEHEWESK